MDALLEKRREAVDLGINSTMLFLRMLVIILLILVDAGLRFYEEKSSVLISTLTT